MTHTTSTSVVPDAYRHEAFFFDDDAEFLQGTENFVRDALKLHQPVMVAITASHTEQLRDALGDSAGSVTFADMEAIGRNPARIIPVWRDFVNKNARHNTVLRGIGEPIWAARSSDELLECQLHEHLLNVAFEAKPAWWLLCPYDARNLEPEVIAEAHRSHPYVLADRMHKVSPEYIEDHDVLQHRLELPTGDIETIAFRETNIAFLRDLILEHDVCVDLDIERRSELVLAVNEVVTNAVRHGDGKGTLHIWRSDNTVVCDIRSGGRIIEPMVGRHHPSLHQEGGRGLWIANQLCDLVQIRSTETGTAVRLHMTS